MTMYPNDGKCSSGMCEKPATTVIQFVHGKRLAYCAQCAKKIKP
jgi:hypothetical protein